MNIDPGPEMQSRIKESFGKQGAMATVGAVLESVSAGEVVIRFPFQEWLTQQNGFLHGGIVTAVVDSACGYAALTMAPADANVLTVEYKVNFLSPAKGDVFIATGRVRKAGRTLTECEGEVVARSGDGPPVLVAVMIATMMILRDKDSGSSAPP